MEVFLIRWSYWLGILFSVLAVLARTLDAAGAPFFNFVTKGNPVSYRSFVDAAFLFLLLSVATAGYAWFNSRASRP